MAFSYKKILITFLTLFIIVTTCLIKFNVIKESTAKLSTFPASKINTTKNLSNRSSNSPKIIKNSSIIKNSTIKNIFNDSYANVWIGTINNGLFEKKSTSNQFIQNKDLPTNITIDIFFQDSDNNLWVTTIGGGLWTKSSNEQGFSHVSNINDKMKILGIFEDKSQNLWLRTYQNGLWEKSFDFDQFQQNQEIISRGNKLNVFVSNIFQDSSNNLWIGTFKSGLWEKINGCNHFTYHSLNIIGNQNIQYICQDTQKNLWVVTTLNGIWEKKNNYKNFVKDQDFGLITSFIDIFEDSEGNLWVGTCKNGLWEDKKNTEEFQQNTQVGLTVNVKKIYEDHEKNLWVATDYSKLWYKCSGENFKQNITVGPNFNVQKFYDDQRGNLWMVLKQNGLWSLKEGNKKGKVVENQELIGVKAGITNIICDNFNNLWIGTNDNGLWESESQIKFENSINNHIVIFSNKAKKRKEKIFSHSFSITITDPDVYQIKINNHLIKGFANHKIVIKFPNKKYGTKYNEINSFQVSFTKTSGKPVYRDWFFIKTNCWINQEKQFFKNHCLRNVGGRKISDSYGYIKGDRHKKTYELFSTLAINNESNQFLQIYLLPSFLYSKQSSYSRIKIDTGKIIKESSHTIYDNNIIWGSNKNNLYMVELIDRVQNRKCFLLQIGGLSINQNFKSKSAWQVAVIVIAFTVLLIGITSVLWLKYYCRKRKLVLLTKKNKIKLAKKQKKEIQISKTTNLRK